MFDWILNTPLFNSFASCNLWQKNTSTHFTLNTNHIQPVKSSQANNSFQYPPKSEHLLFHDFRRYRKGTLTRNELVTVCWHIYDIEFFTISPHLAFNCKKYNIPK